MTSDKGWIEYIRLFLDVYQTKEEALAFVDELARIKNIESKFLNDLRNKIITAYDNGERKEIDAEYKKLFRLKKATKE